MTIPRNPAARPPKSYLFLGGPLNGQRIATDGRPYHTAAVPPEDLTLVDYAISEPTDSIGLRTVAYESRAIGFARRTVEPIELYVPATTPEAHVEWLLARYLREGPRS